MKPASSALAAYAALFAVLLAFGALATIPHALSQRASHELAEMLNLHSTLERRVAMLRKSSEEREESTGALPEKLLLKAPTAGIAEAQLQKSLTEILSDHGAEVTSVEFLPREKENELDKVRLRVSARIGLEGLRNVLYAIEAGTPLLFIEQLSVRPHGDGVRPVSLGAMPRQDVTLVVLGYALCSEED